MKIQTKSSTTERYPFGRTKKQGYNIMVWNLRWCSDPSRRNPSLALWRTIAGSVRTSFLRRYTNSLGVLWSWGDCQKAEGRKGWKGTNSVETNVLSYIQRKANTAAIFWDGWNGCDVTANNMSKPRNFKKMSCSDLFTKKWGRAKREVLRGEKHLLGGMIGDFIANTSDHFVFYFYIYL